MTLPASLPIRGEAAVRLDLGVDLNLILLSTSISYFFTKLLPRAMMKKY